MPLSLYELTVSPVKSKSVETRRYSRLAPRALLLSQKYRLYLHPFGACHFERQSLTPYSIRIVVEPSFIQGLAADCLLNKHVGFNLMPSCTFFLLSPHSRLGISSLRCSSTGFKGFQQLSRYFDTQIPLRGNY